jgi:hypothetical protein
MTDKPSRAEEMARLYPPIAEQPAELVSQRFWTALTRHSAHHPRSAPAGLKHSNSDPYAWPRPDKPVDFSIVTGVPRAQKDAAGTHSSVAGRRPSVAGALPSRRLVTHSRNGPILQAMNPVEYFRLRPLSLLVAAHTRFDGMQLRGSAHPNSTIEPASGVMAGSSTPPTRPLLSVTLSRRAAPARRFGSYRSMVYLTPQCSLQGQVVPEERDGERQSQGRSVYSEYYSMVFYSLSV